MLLYRWLGLFIFQILKDFEDTPHTAAVIHAPYSVIIYVISTRWLDAVSKVNASVSAIIPPPLLQ